MLRDRVEKARGCKLGNTTGPFNEDGECFGNKRYGELLQYVGERCFGLPNWGSHIAQTEHMTLIHSDAVDHDMSVDHPGMQQLGRQAAHGPATQEGFYDMKDRIKGWFVRRHGGMQYSTMSISVATPPAAAPPPVATAPLLAAAPAPVVTAPPPAAAERLGMTPPSTEIFSTKTGET